MSGTESSPTHLPTSRWKSWLPLAGVVSLILLGSFVIRQFGGPRSAEAQAPVRPAAQPRTAAAPQRSPAGPTARPGATSNQAPAAAAREVQPAAAAVPAGKAPSAAATKNLKVMAVVNGEQITRQELARECVRRYGKEVLEGMLNKQLISDACAQQGIEISEQELNAEIERIAGKFGLPSDRWLQMLQEERGFTPDDYRQEVVWPMLAMRRQR